jgi:hypothetical protein
MWAEFLAKAVRVHSLQYGSDAALVSIDEPHDIATRGGL